MTTPLIAGVDEAGRGPLAGPVVAAAVILNPDAPILGLNDSKKISPKKREQLYATIQKQALAFGIASASVEEIDTLNILQATLLAMQRAIMQLAIIPHRVLIDGNCCPPLIYPCQAIIKGDETVPSISAASILAKVFRDQWMCNLDKKYPRHGFAIHKGYPTPQHLLALKQFGITDCHRRSFAPVKFLLD